MRILIPVLTTIVIVVGVFVAAYAPFTSRNYAYAAQSEDFSGDNQTDTYSSGDSNLQSFDGGNSDGNNQKNDNKDKSRPSVISVNPNYGTVGIPVDTNIEVTFSEPVKSSSLTDSTFKLQNGVDNTAVLADISLSGDGTVATLTPSAPLLASTPFNAMVTTGVKDLSGNRLVSEEKWSFTTASSNVENNPNGQGTTASEVLTTDSVTSQEKAAPVIQSIEDDKLVERIFPLIVNKLDGATILNKLDASQLLQKVDGQALLEKVLPFLDIKLVGRTQDGATFHVITGSYGHTDFATSKATCNADETISGGGFVTSGIPIASEPQELRGENWWLLQTDSNGGDYNLQSKALCMKVEVGIKPAGGGP